MRPSIIVRALAALALAPMAARAQHDAHAGADTSMAEHPSAWHLAAQAIPIVTHAASTVDGADLAEGYLAQAAAMAGAALFGGRLRFQATLNGEGITISRGELSTGAFGEGYVDRRHPHTYLHEVIATGMQTLGPAALSITAGRGFAAFGTDDPMTRPFEKYPLNHHLSQILERPMLTGAARVGRIIVDASTFGGDEPTSPSSTPVMRRFGDSWSVRGTVIVPLGVEVQGSYARVASPEQAAGFGLDQRKRNVSARYVSTDGRGYLLAEWARTVDWDHGRREEVFAYESALMEGAVAVRGTSLALRVEQTERPEEQRLADPFRTPRPAPDLGNVGITRWRAATLALMLPSPISGPVRGYPFVEVERMKVQVRDVRSVFNPEAFYGTSSPWMLTAGVRLRYGAIHPRMGRYGVALPSGRPIRALGISDDDASSHQH